MEDAINGIDKTAQQLASAILGTGHSVLVRVDPVSKNGQGLDYSGLPLHGFLHIKTNLATSALSVQPNSNDGLSDPRFGTLP